MVRQLQRHVARPLGKPSVGKPRKIADNSMERMARLHFHFQCKGHAKHTISAHVHTMFVSLTVIYTHIYTYLLVYVHVSPWQRVLLCNIALKRLCICFCYRMRSLICEDVFMCVCVCVRSTYASAQLSLCAHTFVDFCQKL